MAEPKRPSSNPSQTNIAGNVYGPVLSGEFSGPVTVVDARLSSHDRDNRQRMLKQVRTFWIEGVLEQSLYREVMLSLNLQTDPQQVSYTGPLLARQSDRAPELLPAGTSIAQVYIQASQRLLILGAPGAGKTTLLLDLARTLLNQAERDETRPMPVVFNLTTWSQQRQPLERWLVQELRDQYGVGRRIAQEWLKGNRILALLDGLDEVAEALRAACVVAINTFIQEHGSEGIVICSRIADYEVIGSKLALDAAVQVQPLDDVQLAAYFDWIGDSLAGVQSILRQDTELHELARIPLLLNIFALAYQHQRPEELIGLTATAQRQHLFEHYVQRMFDRPARSDPKRYTREQTLRWLRWLASSLVRDNQTIFQIELMQPWWLQRWWQRGLYVVGSAVAAAVGGAFLGILGGELIGFVVRLVLAVLIWTTIIPREFLQALSNQGIGLLFGLDGDMYSRWGVWLIAGLAIGLIVGLVAGSFQHVSVHHQAWRAIIGGLLIIGLLIFAWFILFGYFFGSFVFLAGLMATPLILVVSLLIWNRSIRPTEMLRWSWRVLRARLHIGLIYGLVFGLTGGLLYGLDTEQIFGLIYGTAFGLASGLIVGFGSGFSQIELQNKTRPNQGIWRSLPRSILSCLIVELLLALTFGMVFGVMYRLSEDINGVIGGMLIGLIVVQIASLSAGFYFGGLAFFQHFALRLICTLCGFTPWNYPRFLDYAVERILLRRVGGSYIFVHRMLMEHFASQYAAEQKAR